MADGAQNIIRILGIDPALRCTGYGLVDTDGQGFRVVDCGVIRTPASRPLSECLRRLAGGIEELLETYTPDAAAIEGGFYAKNAKTAMILGTARGAVIAMIARHGKPVYEYAPRRIKQAVCGYGNASKEQIATMVSQWLEVDAGDMKPDATDALGVALCHANTFFTNQAVFLPEPL